MGKPKPPMPGASLPSELGKIEFSWPDGGVPACEFNRLAISPTSELLMVSMMTSPRDCKLIGSMVNGGTVTSRLVISAWGVSLAAPGRSRLPGTLKGSEEGYDLHHCKLGINCEHALLITRNPSFLKVNSPEELWRVLTSPRYTTPLLEEWLPYLRSAMIKNGYLLEVLAHRCDCGFLRMSNHELDQIVITGLEKGEITI